MGLVPGRLSSPQRDCVERFRPKSAVFRCAMLVMAMVGVGFAPEVAWWRAGHAPRAAQERFDPAQPWWEAELPFVVPEVVVRSPAEVASLPATVDRITVDLGGQALGGTIEAVLDRAGLCQLLLVGGRPNLPIAVPWSGIAAQASLRSLGCFGVPVELPMLRTLGPLPGLRALSLSGCGCKLDEVAARWLAGLKTLRQLDISYQQVEPEALRALSVLPGLDTLVLGNTDKQPHLGALLPVMPQLRSLRGLWLNGNGETLSSEDLQHLRKNERLIALSFSNYNINDAGLKALPRDLQHLTLPYGLQGLMAEDLAHLAESGSLRSLGFQSQVPEELEPAVCALIAKLPLECFEYCNALPTAAMWGGLATSPRLRRVRVWVKDTAEAAQVFQRALACRRLEVLVVSVPSMPSPEQLGLLREHPTLRRIVLRKDLAHTVAPTAVELAALRASVRAAVEIW